jgi:hypothetical protein
VAEPSETTQASRGPADADTAELIGAVRALSAQVGGLQAELQALRSQTRSLPAAGADAAGWDDGAPAVRRDGSYSYWVRTLDSPRMRRPAVPRLAVEVAFLVAVALAVAIAELDTLVVIAVMAGAWGLVALAEWTAARASRRRDKAVYEPLAGIGPVFAEDPSWFAPPTAGTMLEAVENGDDTEARLPPASSV